MFDKTTGHGDDMMVAQFDFLFTASDLSRTFLSVVVKNESTTNGFPWSVPLSTIEMKSKCSN